MSPAKMCAALSMSILLAGTLACTGSPANPTRGALARSAQAESVDRVGEGNTPAQLAQHGWTCENVPGHGVHCMDPHAQVGTSVHIQVKVFDTSDITSSTAAFRGTESLIRADRYKDQPCLPGHGTYFLLPFGYYACHHFDLDA